jgi:long-chain acyl-CoA synthetase
VNLKLMLGEAARQYRDKTAITFRDDRVSYARLDEESNKAARALMNLGVNKGDRVAMLLPNSLELITIYFGIVKIGAVAVPLDTKYKPAELTVLFNDCQPKVLVVESSLLPPIVPVLPGWQSVEQVIEMGADYTGRFLEYRAFIADGLAAPTDVDIIPGDIAHIAYTSGPTFRPRGVMLSHGSLVAEARISAGGFQQTDKDVVALFALPLHHAFGLVVILFTSIYKGSTVVVLPGLSVNNLMELVEREKVTMFMGVPFIHAMVVNWVEQEGIKYNLSSLRLCGSAGSALPLDIARKYHECLEMDIVDFWGQTESSGHVTCTTIGEALKPGGVGRALPGWELKIVDHEGYELPPKQPGEIAVRGPIMTGYYRQPEATAEAIRDGWLYTGDLGMVDEKGDVFLTGIKKDMINAKGQNIYPSDIEEVLRSYPGVAEAAVVGIPDKVRGQIIKAVIQLKDGQVAEEPSLKRLCLDRLANYKVPKQFVFVDAMPRTSTGAVNKDALR